jgi:hypothetical protein
MLYTLLIFSAYRYFFAPAEGNEGQGEEEYEFEDDEELEPIFIPLGLWPKPKQRTYYKGSDPEWEEFVKFAKDAKRNKEARGKCERTELCGSAY